MSATTRDEMIKCIEKAIAKQAANFVGKQVNNDTLKRFRREANRYLNRLAKHSPRYIVIDLVLVKKSPFGLKNGDYL